MPPGVGAPPTDRKRPARLRGRKQWGEAGGPGLCCDAANFNAKLRRRAVRIVRDVADVDERVATVVLAAAGSHAEIAIVASLAGVDAAETALQLNGRGDACEPLMSGSYVISTRCESSSRGVGHRFCCAARRARG